MIPDDVYELVFWGMVEVNELEDYFDHAITRAVDEFIASARYI